MHERVLRNPPYMTTTNIVDVALPLTVVTTRHKCWFQNCQSGNMFASHGQTMSAYSCLGVVALQSVPILQLTAVVDEAHVLRLDVAVFLGHLLHIASEKSKRDERIEYTKYASCVPIDSMPIIVNDSQSDC